MNDNLDGPECHNCSDWDRGRRALIAELLSDKTVRAAAGGHALGPTNSLARIVLCQAVEHIAKGAP